MTIPGWEKHLRVEPVRARVCWFRFFFFFRFLWEPRAVESNACYYAKQQHIEIRNDCAQSNVIVTAVELLYVVCLCVCGSLWTEQQTFNVLTCSIRCTTNGYFWKQAARTYTTRTVVLRKRLNFPPSIPPSLLAYSLYLCKYLLYCTNGDSNVH